MQTHRAEGAYCRHLKSLFLLLKDKCWKWPHQFFTGISFKTTSPQSSRAELALSKPGGYTSYNTWPLSPTDTRWERMGAGDSTICGSQCMEHEKKICCSSLSWIYQVWGKVLLPLYSFSVSFTFFSVSK